MKLNRMRSKSKDYLKILAGRGVLVNFYLLINKIDLRKADPNRFATLESLNYTGSDKTARMIINLK